MKRRWFIRCLFMLPILLCVGGWAWGRMYNGYVRFTHDGSWIGCVQSDGVIGVGVGGRFGLPNGWNHEVALRDGLRHFWRPWPDPAFLGFRISHHPQDMGGWYCLSLPYWFLIIVFSLVLFFVWRKTRPKLNPATAFPMEMAASGKQL